MALLSQQLLDPKAPIPGVPRDDAGKDAPELKTSVERGNDAAPPGCPLKDCGHDRCLSDQSVHW